MKNSLSMKSLLLVLFAFTIFSTQNIVAQTIRYVKQNGTGDGSSWQNASADIQAMIDDSQVGDAVWVANGIYKPTKLIKSTKSLSKSFILKDGVSLFGGFDGTETDINQRQVESNGKAYDMLHKTVLSGDDDIPDQWQRVIDGGSTYRYIWEVSGNGGNCYHVVYGGTTPFVNSTRISGFTISNGNATYWKTYAGGAGLMASGNVQVDRCIFSENYAQTNIETTNPDIKYYGGAVTILNTGGNGSVSNSLFEKNMCNMPTLSARGGGLYIENGIVDSCDFKGCVGVDLGGAIYALGGSVSNCNIDDCYSAGGGGIYADQSTISNSILTNNRAVKGGGIYNLKGTVLHTKIANSYAVAEEYVSSIGGGLGASIYNDDGKVIGCVVFNGTADRCGGVVSNGGGVYNTTAHNCISNTTTVAANIYTLDDVAAALPVSVVNCIYDPNVANTNFVSVMPEAGWGDVSDQRNQEIANVSYELTSNSEFIDSGETTADITNNTDILGNPRVVGSYIDQGAYEYQSTTSPVDTADIEVTFATNNEVTIGLGGGSGTSFQIDWGNGTKVTYYGAKNVKGTPLSNKIKIYGKDIVIFKALSVGITKMKIHNGASLKKLLVGGNKLTDLDLSASPEIVGLYCSENKLTALDLTHNTKMKAFECARNEIEGTIDCSQMTALVSAKLFNNKVSQFILPSHSSLTELDCDSNMISSLDLKDQTELNVLNCAYNNLQSIDLSANTKLTELRCQGNQLTALDISALTALITCSVADNNLTSINVSQNTKLEDLYLQNNELTSIDLSANVDIMWLNLENNKISNIDLSMLPKLMQVLLSHNELTQLDITKNTRVNTVKVSHNQLTQLDLSKQASIYWLVCGHNQLSSLDLSNNPYIAWLECDNNMLGNLNVSNLTNLQKIFCDNNQLTSLDLSVNKGVQGVRVNDNQLNTEELDKLLGQLQDVSSVEIHDNNKEWAKIINITNNTGSATANIVPAQNKGWRVITDNNSAICLADSTALRYNYVNNSIEADEHIVSLVVYTIGGQTVMRFGEGEVFCLSSLSQGVYIAVAKNDMGKAFVLKFIQR